MTSQITSIYSTATISNSFTFMAHAPWSFHNSISLVR